MLNIILFGPPGSGKGTQSKKLKEHFQLTHISTGDLLRYEIEKSTPLGISAKQYIDQGQLVPDYVMIGIIDQKLHQLKGSKGIIFDGFPRTIAQAEGLDSLLKAHHTEIQKVLFLEVNESELINRLLSRGLSGNRSDDNEDTIRKRIIEYRTKTEPVAAYYEKCNKVVRIAGEGRVTDIFNLLLKAIG